MPSHPIRCTTSHVVEAMTVPSTPLVIPVEQFLYVCPGLFTAALCLEYIMAQEICTYAWGVVVSNGKFTCRGPVPMADYIAIPLRWKCLRVHPVSHRHWQCHRTGWEVQMEHLSTRYFVRTSSFQRNIREQTVKPTGEVGHDGVCYSIRYYTEYI